MESNDGGSNLGRGPGGAGDINGSCSDWIQLLAMRMSRDNNNTDRSNFAVPNIMA